MLRVYSGGNFFTRLVDDTADCLAWAGSALNPMLSTFQLDGEIFPFLLGIVFTDDLDKFAIAWAALIGDNDAVIRVVFTAFAAESDCYCHSLCVLLEISFVVVGLFCGGSEG